MSDNLDSDYASYEGLQQHISSLSSQTPATEIARILDAIIQLNTSALRLVHQPIAFASKSQKELWVSRVGEDKVQGLASLRDFDSCRSLDGKPDRLALFSTNLNPLRDKRKWTEKFDDRHFWFAVLTGKRNDKELFIWDPNGQDQVHKRIAELGNPGHNHLLRGMQRTLLMHIEGRTPDSKITRPILSAVYYGGEGNTAKGDALKTALGKVLEIAVGDGWHPEEFTKYGVINKNYPSTTLHAQKRKAANEDGPARLTRSGRKFAGGAEE